MSKELQSQLEASLAGEVASDPKTIAEYSHDASVFNIAPQVVTFPKHQADLTALIHHAGVGAARGVSLTPRSAGTDMSGGAIGKSIIVDLTRHFNEIIEITNDRAIVQPGVFYRNFEKATKEHNLLLPSYPASRELCTVGGMVANNSGGEKTLRYGKTEQYVEKLKVMLRDGNEYEFSKLTEAELHAKRKLPTLEGEIYQQLFNLLDKNYDKIKRAKPNVSKNSTGYNLWNIYDKDKGTFDLTQLFVGSQGTLGIITEITFHLITPQPHTQLLIIFLPGIKQLADVVQRVLSFQPSSFESFDDHTFKLAIRFLPDLIKQMKVKNVLSLAWQFLPEMFTILTGGTPELLLLAEFSGESKKEVNQRAREAAAALESLDCKTRVAKSEAEARKYWVMRRESFNLLRHHVHGKRTAPFIDDIVVKPAQLPEFLPKLEEIMSHYDITYTVAGHIGDANFHIIPLMDFTRDDADDIIEELSQKVYDLVLSYGGSISGEHNDGLIRSHFLKQMYGPEIYQLFEQVKQILDPQNIFNPGKKVGSSWEEAKKHLVKR